MKTKFSLWSHHHYGWVHHSGYFETERDAVIAALFETHDFLEEYRDNIRMEIKEGRGAAYEKKIVVYWDDDTPKPCVIPAALYKGDYWLNMEVNFAPAFACKHCGGTGMDHYLGPFFFCWACDGERLQRWESSPRGVEKIKIPSYQDERGAHWCIMKPRPWIRGGDNEYAGADHADVAGLRDVG